MIDTNRRIIDLTWGEIVDELDARYGAGRVGPHVQLNPEMTVFIGIKECALLTGYTPGYIRQLVFKRAIPFHKSPRLKPVRFKRSEVIEWMAGKKFQPISEMADNYMDNKTRFKRAKQ